MKLIIKLTILFLLLESCATFKPNSEMKYLSETTLKEISGIYDGKSLMYNLDRNLLRNTLILDNSKLYTVELNLISENELEAKYFEDGILFEKKIFKVVYKNDGYLYLDNKNFKIVLIPYIFGRIDIQRVRISLDKNGDLIFEVSHFSSGAGLLIIELHMKTDRNKYIYKRIK